MTDRTPRHFNDSDELTSDVNNPLVRTDVTDIADEFNTVQLITRDQTGEPTAIPTAHDALSDYGNGGEIWIEPGIYDVNPNALSKSVTVRGIGAAGNRPILVPTQDADFFTLSDPQAKLQNVTLSPARYGSTFSSATVKVDDTVDWGSVMGKPRLVNVKMNSGGGSTSGDRAIDMSPVDDGIYFFAVRDVMITGHNYGIYMDDTGNTSSHGVNANVFDGVSLFKATEGVYQNGGSQGLNENTIRIRANGHSSANRLLNLAGNANSVWVTDGDNYSYATEFAQFQSSSESNYVYSNNLKPDNLNTTFSGTGNRITGPNLMGTFVDGTARFWYDASVGEWKVTDSGGTSTTLS